MGASWTSDCGDYCKDGHGNEVMTGRGVCRQGAVRSSWEDDACAALFLLAHREPAVWRAWVCMNGAEPPLHLPRTVPSFTPTLTPHTPTHPPLGVFPPDLQP